jgi:hypothetical protein
MQVDKLMLADQGGVATFFQTFAHHFASSTGTEP